MTTAEPKKLNSRQIKFIDAYLCNGGNGTEAAITAGYKESGASVQAYKLLQLPENRHVQQEIKRRQLELQAQTGATAEAIRTGLWKAFSIAEQSLQVTEYDEQGNQLGQYFNAKAAMSMSNIAAELNKMDGNHAVVKQKLEVNTGNVDHEEVLNAARRRLELAHEKTLELEKRQSS